MNGTTVLRTVLAVLTIALLALFVGWIVWWFGGSARVFFATFVVFVAATYVVAAILAGRVLASVLWRYLPVTIKRRYEFRRATFRAIVLSCLSLFVVLGSVINRLWLPGKLQPISLAFDAGLVLVIVALGWFLLAPRWKSLFVFAGPATAFLLLIILIDTTPGRTERAPSPIDRLAAHAYINWTPTSHPKRVGVTHYDSTGTGPGLNLYNSANESIAHLIDNAGKAVHQWSVTDSQEETFDHIELCANGDLVAIMSRGATRRRLVRLDWDSNLLWSVPGDYHHDVFVAKNEDVFTIVGENEIVSFGGLPVPIINEYVEIRTAHGQFKERLPLYPLLERYLSAERVPATYAWLASPAGWRVLGGIVRGSNSFYSGRFDPFHVNTVELTPDTESLVICARNIDLVGIVDVASLAFDFTWGRGELERPHQPSLLPNGNLLIFDNGTFRGFSRVVEVDRETAQITWEYTAESPADFFSSVQGSCQRLSNGNTLVTESTKGRAFEVTPDGQIVWEFYNPEVDEASGRRATIYRVTRIEDVASIRPLSSYRL